MVTFHSSSRLGAWQFLADMPYGSVSLTAIWKVFWNLYSNHTDSTLSPKTRSGNHEKSGNHDSRESSGCVEGGEDVPGREVSPATVEEIQQALKDKNYKAQFVDCLMKTYTSEAVFLLTTFVNMARARPADCSEEKIFINTIVLEIFEVCSYRPRVSKFNTKVCLEVAIKWLVITFCS